MKRIILLSVLLFSIILISAQSAEDLWKMRATEIRKIEKEYAPKKGLVPDPKLKEQRLASIDSLYLPLIREANARESQPQIQSQAQKTQNPPQYGGTATFANDKVKFYGHSYSVTNNANALATLMYADAMSEMIRNRVTIIPTTGNQGGYQGVIENVDKYKRNIEIVITSVGNNLFTKSYALAPGQKVDESLPPGRYKVITKMAGYKDRERYIYVGPENIHNFYGRNVFFYVYGGNNNY